MMYKHYWGLVSKSTGELALHSGPRARELGTQDTPLLFRSRQAAREASYPDETVVRVHSITWSKWR
jgi:hypothetical protein